MKNFLSPSPIFQNTGLALVRCCMGGFLIYHGIEVFDAAIVSKYLSWDVFKNDYGLVLVYAGKIAELIAGILFFLGLFTRVASLLTIGVMGYIAFFIGKGIIWYDDQHPFLFILLSMVFVFTGPGNFSLDKLIFNNKR
jgi:putative oxidoreductase